jgi:hypothetical protein
VIGGVPLGVLAVSAVMVSSALLTVWCSVFAWLTDSDRRWAKWADS